MLYKYKDKRKKKKKKSYRSKEGRKGLEEAYKKELRG